MLSGYSFPHDYPASMSVPAMNVQYCTKCHHTLSIPEYSTLYDHDDLERAFSVPVLSENSEKLISSAEDSLAIIEDTYTRLQAAVKQLRAQHTRLTRYIDQQKAYIVPSPIRQLPTEILSLVFSHACHALEDEDYRTPLSISVTCFKWRRIAISTPALWTYIFVGPVGAHSEGQDRLSLYMHRAKGLPISLKWVVDRRQRPVPYVVPYDEPIYDELQDEHEDLLKEIIGTHQSWKTVELHGLEEIDQETFFGSLDDKESDSQLPLLENLIWSGWDPGDVYNFPTTFTHARKLKTLSLLEQDFAPWGQEYIPWQQMESITLRHWETGVASTLADRGFVERNTKTLILKGPLTAERTSPPVQYLTRLVLQPDYLNDPLITILSSIRLSFLEELTLEDSAGEYRSSSACDRYIRIFAGVLNMLKSSACALRGLKMVSLEVELPSQDGTSSSDTTLWSEEPIPAWKSLLDCLECIHSLQSRVVIVESSIRPPLLTSSFISAINSQRLLPALTSAEFVWRDSDSLPEDEVVRFLESRSGMDGLKKLVSVVLGVREGGEVHSRVLDSMKLLRSREIRASLW